jgi:mono/diheme cytochrome c family protein
MTMKNFPSTLSALAAAAAGTVVLLTAADAHAEGAKASPQVARGEYLVTTSGCHDCHTPLMMGANGPEPDMSRALSGHPAGMALPPAPRLPEGPWIASVAATNTAWAGPWGTSFTANLTPDAETGLGKWTLKDFKDTIRTGRHMGRGRPVLPPMPIPAYRNFNDRDLEAIYAYLRTVPAVGNRVPEPLPPAATTAAQK